MAETWRVVLADGTVREVLVRAGHSFTDGVGYFARLSPTDTMAFGADPRGAVLRLAVARYLDVAEILAPGEPSRAELIAQRDAARAELDRAERNRESASNRAGFLQSVVNDVAFAAGARDHETTVGAVKRVSAQRDAAWREGAEAMRRDAAALLTADADARACEATAATCPTVLRAEEHATARALRMAVRMLAALPIPTRSEVPRG